MASTSTNSKKTDAIAAEKARGYLASLSPGTRKVVKQLRAVIRRSAPGAVAAFSYGIPGFRLNGKPLVWYAGWRQHTSLYPITGAIKKTHAKALEGYDTSKGTVRFPLTKPIPATLVARLVKARVAEVRQAVARAKATAVARRRR
jgi:uncharacterized protein YdhG (YjbR/CyaY superfamily)